MDTQTSVQNKVELNILRLELLKQNDQIEIMAGIIWGQGKVLFTWNTCIIRYIEKESDFPGGIYLAEGTDISLH